MNQLSWLLYAGNVAHNLGPVFFILSAIFIIATIVNAGVGNTYSDGPSHEQDMAVQKRFRGYLWLSAPVMVVCMLLAALCPSKDTLYAIAASEMGGKVLNSQTGSLAEQALNSWLKGQITPAAAQ